MVLRLLDHRPPHGASRKIVIPRSHATRDLLLFLTTIKLCLNQRQGTALAVPKQLQTLGGFNP